MFDSTTWHDVCVCVLNNSSYNIFLKNDMHKNKIILEVWSLCNVIKKINLGKRINLEVFNEVFVFPCLRSLSYRNQDYEIIKLFILFVVFYKPSFFFAGVVTYFCGLNFNFISKNW